MADTTFYAAMAQTTLNLITAKGRDDLVMVRKGVTSYNPDTDTETPGADTTQSLQCIVLPASKGTLEAFDERVEPGSVVYASLRQLKIAASGLTFQPRAGDIVQNIEEVGDRWLVLGCTPVSPAGIPLLFTVTVKKG